MFVSFFARPKLFFLSAIVWALLAIAFWYGAADNLGKSLGISPYAPAVGVAMFWSGSSLWFYFFFALCVAIFAWPWVVLAPHSWPSWPIPRSPPPLPTAPFQTQLYVSL